MHCTTATPSNRPGRIYAGYRTAASIKAANDQLQHFVELLEGEGVTVRRPEELDFNVSVKTPDFEVPRMNTSGVDAWPPLLRPPPSCPTTLANHISSHQLALVICS